VFDAIAKISVWVFGAEWCTKLRSGTFGN